MSLHNTNYTNFYHIPKINLGSFPTPVIKLCNIGCQYKSPNLFVKCDNVSGALYGGNKVRKLEYLIADAKQSGAKRLITSGYPGSNHALATTIYGKKAGLDVTLVLFGSQKGAHVVNNLLADYEFGADIHYFNTYEEYSEQLPLIIQNYEKTDSIPPYIIPAGGSSVIGLAGYINAAFELKTQIENSVLQEPDTIFVPFGTMGTVAGLLIGLKAAQIKSKIIAVSVVPSFVANEKDLHSLIDNGLHYLQKIDPAFSQIKINVTDYCIDNEQFGEGYGISTLQTDSAINLFLQKEDIILDHVYSGKTAAAFLKYISCKENINKCCLFWNTKSSVQLPAFKTTFSSYPEWFTLLLQNSQ